MSRDTEILINRATPLVFGVCGQIDDEDGNRITRVGGSGIFISPFHALTARHVTRELFNTDPMRGDDLKMRVRNAEDDRRSIYFDTPHSSILYQAMFSTPPRSLLWHVRHTWDSSVTDISLMEVFTEGDEAAGMEYKMKGFFELALLPPPVGSHVIMLGYPLANIESNNGVMKLGLEYVLQEGEVIDAFDTCRDQGMYSFPCFQINKPVDHGFSGGPVFWDGKLCGIVSGGGFDNDTYVASLWPLLLMEYQYPDSGILGGTRAFREMLESGVLRSPDWPQIKDRITKRDHDNGKPYAYLESM